MVVQQGRDPFVWRSRALLEVRRGWVAYLAVGVILAAMAGMWIGTNSFERAKGKPTTATITAVVFYGGSRSYPSGGYSVEAKADNGLIGVRSIPQGMVGQCKVGARIPAVQIGAALRLDPWPCRPLSPIPDSGLNVR